MKLSYFFLTLSISRIFCSESARYYRYSTYYITFIRVFPNSVLLFKYCSNVFGILDINEEKKGGKKILFLNIRLIEF